MLRRPCHSPELIWCSWPVARPARRAGGARRPRGVLQVRRRRNGDPLRGQVSHPALFTLLPWPPPGLVCSCPPVCVWDVYGRAELHWAALELLLGLP